MPTTDGMRSRRGKRHWHENSQTKNHVISFECRMAKHQTLVNCKCIKLQLIPQLVRLDRIECTRATRIPFERKQRKMEWNKKQTYNPHLASLSNASIRCKSNQSFIELLKLYFDDFKFKTVSDATRPNAFDRRLVQTLRHRGWWCLCCCCCCFGASGKRYNVVAFCEHHPHCEFLCCR